MPSLPTLPNFLPPSPSEVFTKLSAHSARLKPPFFIQSKILKKVLLNIFAGALESGEMDFLKGKWVQIEISDQNIRWLFSCSENRDVLIRQDGRNDVCVRGALKSFILLAAQREDPDTLFFQRSLVIEGDTELGLEVKNLFDCIESDTLPRELLFALRVSAEYVTLFNTKWA